MVLFITVIHLYTPVMSYAFTGVVFDESLFSTILEASHLLTVARWALIIWQGVEYFPLPHSLWGPWTKWTSRGTGCAMLWWAWALGESICRRPQPSRRGSRNASSSWWHVQYVIENIVQTQGSKCCVGCGSNGCRPWEARVCGGFQGSLVQHDGVTE